MDFNGFLLFLKFLKRGINASSEKSNWEGFTSCAWEGDGSTLWRATSPLMSVLPSGPELQKDPNVEKWRRAKKTLERVRLLVIVDQLMVAQGGNFPF